MDAETAIAIMRCAIYQVPPSYIYYGCNFENEQVERCFAYEFYHQWRILLDIYAACHPQERKLYLNGEIPKKVGGRESIYPDLVLHSGQSNEDSQIVACEIKRAVNNDPYGIIREIYKLLKYLDFCKDGNSNNPVNYDAAVFIMIGCSLNDMKEIIENAVSKSIDEFPHDKQEYVSMYIKKIKESSLDKILCISVGIDNSTNLKLEACGLENVIVDEKSQK